MKILWFAAVLAVFFLISVNDIIKRRIPDRLVGVLAVLGLPGLVFLPGMHLIGIFLVSLPLLILTVLIHGGFGGGDIKLMAAGGWLMGARLIFYGFAFGVMTAGAYCLILLLSGRAKCNTKIPLAPFLCAGMGVTIFLNEFA